jgi:hypothetical protein
MWEATRLPSETNSSSDQLGYAVEQIIFQAGHNVPRAISNTLASHMVFQTNSSSLFKMGRKSARPTFLSLHICKSKKLE